MIRKCFSVYDTVAKVYVNPFYQITCGEAIRAFADAVNDKALGTLSKHPEDFLLYEIGTFDDVNGVMESLVPPNRLALGSDFVRNGGV